LRKSKPAQSVEACASAAIIQVNQLRCAGLPLRYRQSGEDLMIAAIAMALERDVAIVTRNVRRDFQATAIKLLAPSGRSRRTASVGLDYRWYQRVCLCASAFANTHCVFRFFERRGHCGTTGVRGTNSKFLAPDPSVACRPPTRRSQLFVEPRFHISA